MRKHIQTVQVRKITNANLVVKFSQVVGLMKHMHTIHDSNKDYYKCDSSSKSFHEAVDLRRHSLAIRITNVNHV